MEEEKFTAYDLEPENPIPEKHGEANPPQSEANPTETEAIAFIGKKCMVISAPIQCPLLMAKNS